MRHSRLLYAFVCLTAMFITAIADAQPPNGGGERGNRQRRGGFGQRGGFGGGRGGFGGFGGGRGGSISRAMLLRSDDVKEELKVDEGQDATIAAALDAYRQEVEESRPDRSDFEGISDEERGALFDKMRKEREALNKKTDQVLNALLAPEQVKRLDQISVQVGLQSGVISYLKSDDMQDKLSLKEDQVAKLDEAEDAAREAQGKVFEQMRESFRGGRDRNDGDAERPDFRGMMEKLRTESETKAMAVLTDEQKAKLTEMKGKAFEFDMRSLFGRGRGGFGGDRGNDRRRGDRRRGDDDGGRRRPTEEPSDAI